MGVFLRNLSLNSQPQIPTESNVEFVVNPELGLGPNPFVNFYPLPNDNSVTVDWGDGTIDNNTSHAYEKIPGLKTVKIYRSNTTTKIKFHAYDIPSQYANNDSIISLTKYDLPTNDLSIICSGLPNLSTISADCFKNNPNVTTFNQAFRWCPSLTSIPADLFRYNTNVSNFNGCFADCTSLAAIPNGLFRYNTSVSDFSMCFYHCTSLVTMPQDLFYYNTLYTNFNSCFDGDIGITSNVPPLWSWYTSLSDIQKQDCFQGCTNAANYADIPEEWR
jgi:hypothetical protein